MQIASRQPLWDERRVHDGRTMLALRAGPCMTARIAVGRLAPGSHSVTVDWGDGTVETLSGEIVRRDGSPVDGQAEAKPGEEAEESAIGEKGGESMEDILFAPVANDVVKGVRIKVTMGDELLRTEEEEERKTNRISVFSNVDYLLGKYKEKKAEEKKSEEESAADAPPAGKDEDQEPVSLVWEANGRCDPHRVWVYLDGKKPESGLCIKVDRFGAAKILSGEEED